MSLDSDVALLGTGVAPLVAASHLLAEGKSVLILNPDWDFFLEDSELPLDPLLPFQLTHEHLAQSRPERALSLLRPEFPGAIEFWSETTDSSKGGFHDLEAPHVRSRGRLWVASLASLAANGEEWQALEDLFVESSDAGLNPKILEGIQAARRFPGFSAGLGDCRGLLVPKSCDVDVSRYRNGLLEFVRERLGPERVICAAGQIELMPGGVRFYTPRQPKTAHLREGMLVFWTPRLSQWVLSQLKRTGGVPTLPKGIRLWEQWSLVSRDLLDPSIVGGIRGEHGYLVVWAEVEGSPSASRQPLNRLSVLRAGPLVSWDPVQAVQPASNWASADSFASLSMLCQGFLKWEKYSIRSMRPRAIFEWESRAPWFLSPGEPKVQVVPACDGSLVDVVESARLACERMEGHG